MKKIVGYISFIALALCAGCHDDDDTLTPVLPQETGTFTDADGQTYGWAKYGDLYWMTENYRGGKEPYYEQFIDDGDGRNLLDIDAEQEEATYEVYGNYYTLSEAREFAPQGWELPTDEDWKQLEQALGMSASETDLRGERGGTAGEMLQSKQTLGLQTGGLIMGFGSPYTLRFRHLQVHGYYWTATEDETATFTAAFYRKISLYAPGIERNSLVTALESYQVLAYTHMNVRYISRTRPE